MVEGLFDASVLGEPIKLLDGEDQPLSLSPGKTFILLPPGAGSTAGGVTPGFVTYESNGETVTRNILAPGGVRESGKFALAHGKKKREGEREGGHP
jgi:hypothetical protein